MSGDVGLDTGTRCANAECVVTVDHWPVQQLPEAFGIELRDDDGVPWHCGQKMIVRSGLFGADFAECQPCGLTVGNALSPHINAGIVFVDEVYEAHPGGAWVALRRAAPPSRQDQP